MPLLKSRITSPVLSNWWDEVFSNDLFDMPATLPRIGTKMPAVNIRETDNEYEVEVAAPGLEKNDIKVDIDHGLLNISCEKEMEDEEKGDNFTRKEFSYNAFRRSFSLPEFVNPDKINAKYENGILNITIPKKEEAKPKPTKSIKIS